MVTQFADLTVTPIIWLLVLYRARIAYSNRADQRVKNTWFFIFFFALTMTFHMDVVYGWVGRLSGIGNLSWLLAYATWFVSAYFAVQWSYNLRNQAPPKWINLALLFSLLVLCTIFFNGVAVIGFDSPSHYVAETSAQLLFMLTLYLYSVKMCSLPLRNCYQLCIEEKEPVTRFRMRTLFVAVLAGTSVFVLRGIYVVTGYWQKPLPSSVHDLAMFILIVGGIIFALFFVPRRFITRPVLFVDKAISLWRMTTVRNQINVFCPAILDNSASLWTSFRNLDQQLFTTVKAILDGKFLLAQCVQFIEADFGFIEDAQENFRSVEVDLRQWGEKKIGKAIQLSELLATVEDDKEYAQLTEEYAKLGKSMRQEKVALWISRIFHPFILPLPVMFLAIYLSGFTLAEAALWTGLFIGVVIIPATLFILWNVRTGRFSDRDVSNAKERRLLYAIGLICVFVYMVLCFIFNAPWIVFTIMWGLMLSSIVAGIINRFFTKVSIHTIAAVGSATIMFLVAPVIGLIVGLIALGLSWSRIQLGHHSLQQVILGWIVAIVCISIVFQMY